MERVCCIGRFPECVLRRYILCFLVPGLVQWALLDASGRCTCGNVLVHWRLHDAVFFTLSMGMLRGKVIIQRCHKCRAVFAGHWRWDDVSEESRFPEGFHAPRWNLGSRLTGRWFLPPCKSCESCGCSSSCWVTWHVAA